MRHKNIAFMVVGIILFFFVCPWLISMPSDIGVITGVFLMAVYAYVLYCYVERIYKARINQQKESGNA